jgi:hypothetical protein
MKENAGLTYSGLNDAIFQQSIRRVLAVDIGDGSGTSSRPGSMYKSQRAVCFGADPLFHRK